jgi:hypothetical protein
MASARADNSYQSQVFGIGPIALPSQGDPPGPNSWFTPPNTQFSTAILDVKSWSPSWLAYSGAAGIAVTADELGSAPAVQAALEAYAECGGCLMVQGAWTVPASWESHRKQFGDLTVYYPGFGVCFVRRAGLGAWKPEQGRMLVEAWLHGELPWTQIRSIPEANRAFPIIGKPEVPVRGLFLVMLLFALAIGPVNLLLLGRLKRRIWLLWTVPLVSVATSAAVLGYMTVTEGWKGHVRSAGLTFLDEVAGRATTLGWTGIYTPVAPGDGLHFGYGTEVMPHLAQDKSFYSHSNPRDMDWTYDQHLTRGWVAARVPAHFLLRKSEARPERLAVSRAADGTLTVTNSLGAEIRRVTMADRQGNVYTAGPVGPGESVVLVRDRSVPPLAAKPEALRSAFTQDWLEQIHAVAERPQDFLMPGCYMATLANTPFIENSLAQSIVHPGESVVYGLMKTPIE